jgi:hypothetical protein
LRRGLGELPAHGGRAHFGYFSPHPWQILSNMSAQRLRVRLQEKWLKIGKPGASMLVLRANVTIIVKKQPDSLESTKVLARVDTATDATLISRKALEKARIAVGTPAMQIRVNSITSQYTCDLYQGCFSLEKMPGISIQSYLGLTPKEVGTDGPTERFFRRLLKDWRKDSKSPTPEGLVSAADLLKKFNLTFKFENGSHYMDLEPRNVPGG